MNFRAQFVMACFILLVLPGLVCAAEPAIEIQRSRVYVERDSGSLAADVYLPSGKGPFPGMLVVHGGAWTIGSRAQLAAVAQAFAENGYTAVAISYRLAPQYKFPAQIYDCEAAVRWMRAHASELKLDPDRIGGFGYSAGGHLVALLGTLSDKDLREKGVPANAPSACLQCVLAGGAPCDFRVMPPDSEQIAYWLGGSRAKCPDAYRDASPAAYIRAGDPPMFFFHGEHDLLVPIASPIHMVSLLKAANVPTEMYTVKDTGHIEAIFNRPAIEHAFAFADKYLKTKDAATANAMAKTAATKPVDQVIHSSRGETSDGN